MDKSTVELYRNRWQAVAAIETQEQRKATSTQRWQQLNAIVRMAAALELPQENDEIQDAVAMQRWNRLRNLYLAELKKHDGNSN
ncbi:MAG TPA: hypothetical protein ENK32_05330 [Anaerolineae bacterium]|nr:hypothetical protein [Anaerolineae bacterium]